MVISSTSAIHSLNPTSQLQILWFRCWIKWMIINFVNNINWFEYLVPWDWIMLLFYPDDGSSCQWENKLLAGSWYAICALLLKKKFKQLMLIFLPLLPCKGTLERFIRSSSLYWLREMRLQIIVSCLNLTEPKKFILAIAVFKLSLWYLMIFAKIRASKCS